MPEFIMPIDDCRKWESLPAFVQGFIEAMYFCEQSCFDSEEWFSPETQRAIEEGQSDGTIPSDATFDQLHAESLALIVRFCEGFQTINSELLALAYDRDGYDETQAGRDLYYTHCGAGVGYWDRAALENDSAEYEALTREMVANRDKPDAWQAACSKRSALKAESLGERLSKAAGRGEVNPFFGGHVTLGDAPFVHVDLY